MVAVRWIAIRLQSYLNLRRWQPVHSHNHAVAAVTLAGPYTALSSNVAPRIDNLHLLHWAKLDEEIYYLFI